MKGFISLLCLVLIYTHSSNADCTGGRYLDPVPPPEPTDVLFPMPSKVSFGETTIMVSKTFQFNTASKSALLARAFARYVTMITEPLDAAPRQQRSNRPNAPVASEHTKQFLKLKVMDNAAPVPVLLNVTVTVNEDDETLNSAVIESYKLSVFGSQAQIYATSVFGALKGLETFSQLVQYTSAGPIIQSTPWLIQDQPRFPHRGVLIDSSRRFLPVATVQRVIDGLSYAKMNVLHWHIVDAQSFPIESIAYPLLTQPFADDEYYTQQNLRDIVAYAKDRGVRVIPEIDTPGHTASWGIGYPEITTCRDKTRQEGYCNENPCGNLDPSNNKTYAILSAFVNEMMAIFTDDMFHFGADEVKFNCWETPAIQSWMTANNINGTVGAFNYYEQQVYKLAKAGNKTPVHWQEVFDENLQLPANAVIQAWIDFTSLQNIVKAGYKAILANYNAWYLDCGFGNWCPYCSWVDVYNNDPFTGAASLKPAELARILGGEVALWSEQVNEYSIDSRLWPRAAAGGERLWSPRAQTDMGDAFKRILRHSCRLASRGIYPDQLIPGSGHKSCIYIQE